MSAIKNVPIELDRPRQLRLTIGSVAQAERKLEEFRGERVNFREILTKGLNLTEIQALVWAALVNGEKDKTLTFEQVGDLLGFGDLVQVTAAINRAFLEQLPEAKETKEAGEGDPLDQSTGSNSGALHGLN